ncbi:MAG: S9 family peptidase [Armatimonadetes bacterium]|nr:S9 family peptidase [Armatimonadota bacterium]
MARKTALILLALAPLAISAAPFTPEMQAKLEKFYKYPTFNGRSPSGAQLSPDGKHVVFGYNKTGARKVDVWMMSLPSGDIKQIIAAEKFTRPLNQDDKRTEEQKKDEITYDGGIGGFTWAPDGKEFLFQYKGRTWLSDPEGKDIRPLFDTNEQVTGAQYSLDGKYLGFIRGQNVFTVDRKTGFVKQLTFISAPGTGVGGFEFSPDSKKLSVSWYDNTKESRTEMMDYTKDRAQTREIGRDWNGSESYNFQFGFVDVTGGLVKFVKIPRYHWDMSSAWAPDSKSLALVWKDPDSKNVTLSLIDPDTAKKRDIYKEKAPKLYISDWRPVEWTRDSKRVLLGTDIEDNKFTFNHIISMDTWGKDIQTVYKQDHDVTSMMRPRDSDRLVLVTHSRSPLMTEITVVEPNGKLTQHAPVDGCSVPREFDGSGTPMVTPDGKVMLTLASAPTQPYDLWECEPKARRLTFSQPDEFKAYRWAPMKEVTFKAPDGATLHAQLITPPDLKPGEKVPAVISDMYANTGKMSWGGYFANFLATECRFAVLKLDARASYGYGGEFHSGYYQSLGVIDADEYVAAANYLKALDYVKGDRIACWGWSYGGFQTCMNLLTKPGVFYAGVAVASVTDWKNYNEGYTRERLGPVKGNEEVYKKTSPISHAAGLQDHLLLVHGILDDNVLAADTIRLMQKLIENNKHFDVMLYPHDDHGIGRDESRPHVFVTIAKYLYETLTQE